MYNQQPHINPMQYIQQQMDQLQQEYQSRLGELKQQAQSVQMNLQNPYAQQPQQQTPQVAPPTQQAQQAPNSVQQLAVLGDIKGLLDKLVEVNTSLLDKLNGTQSQIQETEEAREVKPNKTEKK